MIFSAHVHSFFYFRGEGGVFFKEHIFEFGLVCQKRFGKTRSYCVVNVK